MKHLFRKGKAGSRVRSSSEVVMPAKAQTFVHLLMAFLLAVSFMQPLVPRAFADDAAASSTAESAAAADESVTALPEGAIDNGGGFSQFSWGAIMCTPSRMWLNRSGTRS